MPCRGGDPGAGAWLYAYPGSDNLDDVGWYGANAGDHAHKVGEKLPNTLGLYDMTGNKGETVGTGCPGYPTRTMSTGGTFVHPNESGFEVSVWSPNNTGNNHAGFRVAGPASIGVEP
jgi:formylglycine-generating enzyme required for sulfatase activity